ncbi:hypothetical protein BGZ65_008495, partial [Modicella reniformis]
MAIMPITPTTLQSPPSLESPSGAKAIKTMPPSRTNSQPFYDKDLPPTPTSSSHLGAPDIAASGDGTALIESSNLDHTPTPQHISTQHTLLPASKATTTSTVLEPTPDNSTLQLASSTSSSSSTSSTSASPATPMLPVQTTTLPGPKSGTQLVKAAVSTRATDRPQSIALASGTYDREDMLPPHYSSPTDNGKERVVSKRVTLMGPLPPFSGSGHASEQQQQHRQLSDEYRATDPESAIILPQDNTPSSSSTNTTTLTTRTSTTPEPSNGFHGAQHHGPERNGFSPDDSTLVSTSHRRPRSLQSNNNQLASDYNNGDHHSTSSSHPDGQSQGHTADTNAEDPSRIKPRRVLGNYHMSKTLGAGSMGKVKLGVHSRTRDK